MKVRASAKTYDVVFEDGYDFIPALQSAEAYFVIDKNVYDLYGNQFAGKLDPERLIVLPALEENKTAETALGICEKFTQIPAKRNSLMVSIGGGIIQDVTGFAANILYRGIRWIFIPTTLLAICDSCIGGKTSLNYKTYKNLLGTFYPPDTICIVTDFVRTLTGVDYNSGLGEVIKFNVMAGKQGLDKIESNMDGLLARDPELLNEFVERSLAFKKEFIEADEFDKGERVKLNFAHTFGHALETVSVYAVPHGLAVAIGMLIADRISLSRGLMREETVARIEAVIKKIVNVPLQDEYFRLDEIMGAMRKDKKQVDDSLRAILLSEDMELHIAKDINAGELGGALDYIRRMLQW